jgi:hypothetical protein
MYHTPPPHEQVLFARINTLKWEILFVVAVWLECSFAIAAIGICDTRFSATVVQGIKYNENCAKTNLINISRQVFNWNTFNRNLKKVIRRVLLQLSFFRFNSDSLWNMMSEALTVLSKASVFWVAATSHKTAIFNSWQVFEVDEITRNA